MSEYRGTECKGNDREDRRGTEAKPWYVYRWGMGPLCEGPVSSKKSTFFRIKRARNYTMITGQDYNRRFYEFYEYFLSQLIRGARGSDTAGEKYRWQEKDCFTLDVSWRDELLKWFMIKVTR